MPPDLPESENVEDAFIKAFAHFRCDPSRPYSKIIGQRRQEYWAADARGPLLQPGEQSCPENMVCPPGGHCFRHRQLKLLAFLPFAQFCPFLAPSLRHQIEVEAAQAGRAGLPVRDSTSSTARTRSMPSPAFHVRGRRFGRNASCSPGTCSHAKQIAKLSNLCSSLGSIGLTNARSSSRLLEDRHRLLQIGLVWDQWCRCSAPASTSVQPHHNAFPEPLGGRLVRNLDG
jgi:hypothetical protein